MKEYTLDDEPIDWSSLIRFAREEGYYSDSGIYQTSEAADFLRKLGHTVERNPDYSKV